MEKYRKMIERKQRQKRREEVKKTTLTVALSAMAGALSALFIAPKTEEINKSLCEAKDTIKEKVETSITIGKEKVKDIVEEIEKKIDKTSKKVENIKEDIKEGTEKLKDTKEDIKEDINK